MQLREGEWAAKARQGRRNQQGSGWGLGFGRSVNPISTRGRLSPTQEYSPPRFPDLPPVLVGETTSISTRCVSCLVQQHLDNFLCVKIPIRTMIKLGTNFVSHIQTEMTFSICSYFLYSFICTVCWGWFVSKFKFLRIIKDLPAS